MAVKVLVLKAVTNDLILDICREPTCQTDTNDLFRVNIVMTKSYL